MWTTLATSARNLLFPPLCRSCGEALPGFSEEILCPTCHRAIRAIADPVCLRCGAPAEGQQAQEGGAIGCGWCHGRRFAFEAARSAAVYAGPLRDLILEFKFKGSARVQPHLLQILLSGAERHFANHPFDVIIPVPLHPLRRFQREFNQAEVLAKALSNAWSIPIETRALSRVGWHPPQSRLSGKWRAENLKRAFRAGRARTEGLRVLLVDDVMTTGFTLSACAETLVESGAASVSAFTLARRLSQGRIRAGGDRENPVG